jgi:hypothetical protein
MTENPRYRVRREHDEYLKRLQAEPPYSFARTTNDVLAMIIAEHMAVYGKQIQPDNIPDTPQTKKPMKLSSAMTKKD